MAGGGQADVQVRARAGNSPAIIKPSVPMAKAPRVSQIREVSDPGSNEFSVTDFPAVILGMPQAPLVPI
jgi:hypothetical protein